MMKQTPSRQKDDLPGQGATRAGCWLRVSLEGGNTPIKCKLPATNNGYAFDAAVGRPCVYKVRLRFGLDKVAASRSNFGKFGVSSRQTPNLEMKILSRKVNN